MPIIVTCQNCSARHRIRGAPKDRRLKCKNCGKMLFIPRVDDSQRSLEDNHDFNLRDEASRAGALQLIKQLNETQSAETPASAPLGKRVVGFLFTSVLSCLMVGVVWWGMGYLLTAWSSASWPHVEGTIVSSDVMRWGKGSRVVIKYRYVVNSATYTSDRVTVIADSGAVWGGVSALSSRFPQGVQVPVYYDSKSPDSAALITGTPGLLYVPIPLLVLACFVVWYGTYASFLTLIGRPQLQPAKE